MSGFGAMPYGSGPFGTTSIDVPVGLSNVRQVALNAVELTFVSPPQVGDRTLLHDTLRPANWELAVVEPYGSAAPLPQWVEAVDALTVRVLFDANLTQGTVYQITGINLYDAAGVPYAAVVGEFVSLTPQRSLTQPQTQSLYDIANPANEGTFQLTVTGDYANDSQFSALKKRVIRRATTAPGGFFHLPEYGLARGEKSAVTPSTLTRLQAQALAQVQREPEVLAARVSVRQDPAAPNIVTLTFALRTRGGDRDPFSATLNLGA